METESVYQKMYLVLNPPSNKKQQVKKPLMTEMTEEKTVLTSKSYNNLIKELLMLLFVLENV